VDNFLRLKVGNLEVDRPYIKLVLFVLGDTPVHFELIAPEDAGKNLESKLREFEKESAIIYEAEDYKGQEMSGLCDIVDLEVAKDESKAPALYRISGKLKMVT